MKKLLLVLVFLGTMLTGISTRAQSKHQNSATTDTISLEQFTAQVGRTVTITDYKMPDVSLGMNRLYNRIRKATVDGETRYYYLFSKNSVTSDLSVLFALNYDEVAEMRQAIVLLKNGIEGAIKEGALYKESRYATYGIVRVGYFVEDGKAKWFVDSNPNGIRLYRRSFGAFNLQDITPVEKALLEAQHKMDQLRGN